MAKHFPVPPITLYKEEIVHRPPPANLVPCDTPLFSHEYVRTYDAVHCHHYQDAVVSSSGLAAYKKAHHYVPIPQLASSERISKKLALKTLVHIFFYSNHAHIPHALFVTDVNASGYFHWITDVLPKLLLTQDNELATLPLLVPEKYTYPFVMDSLRTLGISSENIIQIPKNKKLHVKNLYVIGSLTLPAGTGNYRAEIMKSLRNKITTTCGVQNNQDTSPVLSRYGKRLYISRTDARYRAIVNEQAILPLLEQYGYKMLQTSSLHFTEQVQLFSQAESIIGLHGAGLTNMLWMTTPGAVVAEIRNNGDSHNNCYFSLASALDLPYYYSLAERTSQKPTQQADFIWSKDSVRVLMNTLHD